MAPSSRELEPPTNPRRFTQSRGRSRTEAIQKHSFSIVYCQSRSSSPAVHIRATNPATRTRQTPRSTKSRRVPVLVILRRTTSDAGVIPNNRVHSGRTKKGTSLDGSPFQNANATHIQGMAAPNGRSVNTAKTQRRPRRTRFLCLVPGASRPFCISRPISSANA